MNVFMHCACTGASNHPKAIIIISRDKSYHTQKNSWRSDWRVLSSELSCRKGRGFSGKKSLVKSLKEKSTLRKISLLSKYFWRLCFKPPSPRSDKVNRKHPYNFSYVCSLFMLIFPPYTTLPKVSINWNQWTIMGEWPLYYRNKM